MFFCEDHGGVEADYGEIGRNMEYFLNYGFPGFRVKEIDLGRIIPGHTGSVVTVIDVPGIASMVVHPLENYGAVGFGIVMVFQVNAHTVIVREVLTGKVVAGKGAFPGLNEKVRIVDDPGGIHTGMIRHHVRSHADAPTPGAGAEIVQSRPSSQFLRDFIVIQAVGACGRFRISANLLYARACG